jgi:hypothetical protein
MGDPAWIRPTTDCAQSRPRHPIGRAFGPGDDGDDDAPCPAELAMRAGDNPYAPPTAGAISPIPIDPQVLAGARAELARHLADPAAAAADCRRRWGLPRLGWLWLFPAYCLVCALAAAAVLGRASGGMGAIAFATTLGLHALCYGLVFRGFFLHWFLAASTPKQAMRLWLLSLAPAHVGLTPALLAPNARADAARRILTAAYRRELAPVRPLPGGLPAVKTEFHGEDMRLIARDDDLAEVACAVRVVTLRTGPLLILLALTPYAPIAWSVLLVQFERSFRQVRGSDLVDAFDPWFLACTITFALALGYYLWTRRSRRIACTKLLLRGSDARWYLLDGTLQDDEPGPGGA